MALPFPSLYLKTLSIFLEVALSNELISETDLNLPYGVHILYLAVHAVYSVCGGLRESLSKDRYIARLLSVSVKAVRGGKITINH